MELNWLEALFYGLISGFAEFLPISAEAHRKIFLTLIGRADHSALQLSVRIGCFSALLITVLPMLLRIYTERRIAAVPPKRRRRQPDIPTLMHGRAVRVASVSALILLLIRNIVDDFSGILWLLGLLLMINGVLLYMQPFLPGANKDARTLSGLDAMIVGIAAGCGVIPGISRIGAGVSLAQMRGADRQYATNLTLTVLVPVFLMMIILDGIALAAVAPIGSMGLICCLLSGIASFGAGYLAIFILRFLSVKVGFSGFAYYSWGAGLFVLILYLI